jgi:hypothetical protein
MKMLCFFLVSEHVIWAFTSKPPRRAFPGTGEFFWEKKAKGQRQAFSFTSKSFQLFPRFALSFITLLLRKPFLSAGWFLFLKF